MPDTDHGGITAIEVGGFKSLVDTKRIEVRPLTILAGANSSGKSSIIQPLLLLKQTLEATYDPGPLLLDGPNVRFTSADQFFAKPPAATKPAFSTKIEAGSQDAVTLKFGKVAGAGIDIEQMIWQWQHGTLTLRPDITMDEILSGIDETAKKELFPFELYKSVGLAASLKAITRTRCFLSPTLELRPLTSSQSSTHKWEIDELFRGSVPFPLLIRSIIHVPGLRGNPERTYKTTGVGSLFPGTFETYVASIVNHW